MTPQPNHPTRQLQPADGWGRATQRRRRHAQGVDACGIGFVANASGHAERPLVVAALEGLARVRHRGAVAADARTSDGTGLLTPIPPGLYGPAGTGVVMLFTTPGQPDPTRAVTEAAAAEGLVVTQWRNPPVDPSVLGDLAARSLPEIRQALIAPANPGGAGLTGDADDHDLDAAERAAYRMRRRLTLGAEGTYVVSCSFRTVTHKGLIVGDALADFWLDLADESFAANFAVYHQRFSTNTLPTWERAQPFRALCHNGEVNTIDGNANRMRGRGTLGTEMAGLGEEDLFHPLLDPDDSDSGMLDETLELLVHGGRSATHAMAMVMPEAWEHARDLTAGVRGFFAYHSALVEPWDGPAGVIFTDGTGVGAALDRNGLRPLRWAQCEDGLVVCGSEAGAVDTSGRGWVRRGRLGPGRLLWVQPGDGPHALHTDRTVKASLADVAPWASWAADGFSPLELQPPDDDPPQELAVLQACHGYTREELAMMLRPMAADAHEPTFSMGDDSPLPPMAGRARPIHHYLRQRFAQVTNPPIDPLRERLVMSTRTLIGPRSPLLSSQPAATRLLELPTFVVTPATVTHLDDPAVNPFGVVHLDATFDIAEGRGGLLNAVTQLATDATAAVRDGTSVIVVDNGGVNPNRAAVPSLLAVGAICGGLVNRGLRDAASVIVVADDARDVHAVAALVGYGADVVCPRLALWTVANEADHTDNAELVGAEAAQRLVVALEAGVAKVMSKMGIATVDSYRGAQLFDSIGLDASVVDVCFGETSCVLGGIGWDELGDDVLNNHRHAYPDATGGTPTEGEPTLPSPGFYRVRTGGEPHGKSKEVVAALNDVAVKIGGTDPNRNGGPNADDPTTGGLDQAAAHVLQRAIAAGSATEYARFADMVDRREPLEPHDLLELVAGADPIPVDEVEPASVIVRRFSTGAMSHGALSAEAHETLAQAMNLLGASSNCGEGGEDPARFATRGQGRNDRNSRTKQVASGRFGVTPQYLAHADEIQIKMAQGSKPGEGGQLPGHKVTPEIARLRHTQPGIGLISPPPHHDIYSIEDLAQLIFDLKQVNAAEVSVKLVATDGVGTIAAGVAKALADTIHISGANGGTGASPLTSIKHAGMPWELGLAEAQQALVANGLRSRVRLCVDGGLLTGRQVMVAAALGADAFSFGTAAMIAEGCIMLRACHRDTCKPGIATQRPGLRANFAGTPEGVAAYFMFVAEEIRNLLASVGARTVDDIVGRTELLTQRTTGNERVDRFDLAPLLAVTGPPDAPRRHVARTALQDPRSVLGDDVAAAGFRSVWEGDRMVVHRDITNADRTVGAALGGAIAVEHGLSEPPGSVALHLSGTAGQSLGAFVTHGVDLRLVGEANDFVGKGMGGGRIVVVPPDNDVTLGADDPAAMVPVLAGNTCLYGATGGELFVAGAVGERFAVRNSGATAVVEAAGDHCCEYMTGGTVVVLGRVGYNLGAGMTGGRVFVWDPEVQRLVARVNGDLVDVHRPDHDDLGELQWLVERFVADTGSARATALVEHFDDWSSQLWAVSPRTKAQRISSGAARRVTAA